MFPSGSSGKSRLSFLQKYVLSWGVHPIQRDSPLYTVSTRSGGNQFSWKKPKLAVPWLLLQNLWWFQDLQKDKAGIRFCLSGPESKTQRKKKKMEVKEAKGGAGLRHVSILYSRSSVWFSISRRDSSLLGWPKGDFSSSLSSGFLFSFLPVFS